MTERTGYLNAEEVSAAQILLPADTPYAITGVSRSQFSIARHYGGITYNGSTYTYMPEHDELIRDDVLALAKHMRRLASKAQRAEAASKQHELDL